MTEKLPWYGMIQTSSTGAVDNLDRYLKKMPDCDWDLSYLLSQRNDGESNWTYVIFYPAPESDPSEAWKQG